MIPGTGQITDAKRELLEKLLREDALTLGADADAFPRRVPGEPVHLSFGQEQLWLHSQLAMGSPLYNEPVTVRKIGSLDAAVLERSLNEIIRRHEAWRTTFTTVDGQAIQVVHPALNIPLPVADLTHLPEDAREQEAVRLATEDARKPFDLAQGPLLRARLVKLAENEHRLFLSLHHLTFDGVSIYRIFFPELIALYNDFSKGRPSPLEDLPIQYADYVAWERKVISEETESEHLDYWRHQLRGVLPELRLPTDRPGSTAQTFRGSMLPFALSKSLTESLRALSKRECTTLFTTMLAGFITLLHRYSGQEDILLGTATSTRRRPELESLIGFFLNTLVLRTDVSGQPTFRELLGRAREVVIGALSHEVPYQHLVSKLHRQRRASHNAMFRVMFSLEPPLPTIDPAWKLTQMDVENGVAKFDLSLELDERREAIIGRFIYNTDLFNHATMERIAGHWRTLLEGIVADPGRPIPELTLLTEPERHQLLVEWNDTEAEYPRDLCVHDLFEAQAARVPDNVAVVFENQRLSYRELNRLANRVAHRLRELGVGPDVRVGICVERSLEMIVGLLAILKAGGAYLPLDPEHPKQRLAFMMEDARMPVLLTQRRWLERLPDCGAQIVELDGYIDPIAGEDSGNLRAGTTAGDLAYVLYTSGSTGSPKGVEIPHRGIARLLFGTDYAKLDEHEVLLQISPLSFDASTFEIWGALLRGGCCVLFPGRVPSARALGDVLAKHRVSTLWLTTSLFNTVIDEAPEVLSNVRQLLVGGEALSVPHVRRALELLPNVHLINGYGPTESTTFACCYAIPKHLDPTARSIPIGSPIANTRVYVLDQRMELVPAGVPGELYIGGDGLARGYLSRPELTVERFVPDPFSSEPGSRLYKTGDLARYLPDGNIEFLGRMDDQVKIRGFRVEPGEVEVALAAHPGVKATAVGCQEWTGEKCLVAYWVAKEVPGPSINDLRRFLQEKLPQHMVPAAFVRLDAIPLTPSGKVDRPGLPAITNLQFPHDEMPDAPQDRFETELAQIWEGVLGTRPIGVNDNFFGLGGHSLAAARVLARVEKALGKELSMAALFQAPTVRELAALLRAQGSSSDAPSVGTIKPGGSRPPFFCVFAGAIFRALTQRLEADLPVLSLNLDPSEIKQLSFPYRLEEIAECLVKTIRRQQPAGPYYLGGLCINGLVAYEVAQQLMAQGQRVALLALFDSANPIYAKTAATGVRYWAQRVRFHMASLWHNRFKDMRGFVMERLKGMLDNARRDWWSVTSRLRSQPANGRLRDLDQIVYLAVRAYQPQPYAGRVVLFRPADRILDIRYGWGDLVAGGIDVRENPGDHLSILRPPNHEILASSLTACLREASEHEEQVSTPTK